MEFDIYSERLIFITCENIVIVLKTLYVQLFHCSGEESASIIFLYPFLVLSTVLRQQESYLIMIQLCSLAAAAVSF